MTMDVQDIAADSSGGADPLLMGVELGGTKINCILGYGPNRILAQERVDTTTPEQSLGAVEAILAGWQRTHAGIRSLGIASFGPIDIDPLSESFGTILQTTKAGWEGAQVAARLSGSTGLPIRLDTDVNGAALAEGRWGAAREARHWAYITVGTGIGVGIMSDRKPVYGSSHGEAGHMLVRRAAGDDWQGACSFHGDCVEGLASGPAVAARLGRSADTVSDDDPVWDLVAHAIAGLIHNVLMTNMPELFLLGGGIPTKRVHLLGRVRTMVATSLAGYQSEFARTGVIDQRIVMPELGDDAGPLGALALAADVVVAGKGNR